MRQWILGMVLVASVLGGIGTAQADYEDGQRAWDAGRHSEALHEWQAAANAGDAKAMLALGRLYMQGLGAPQNYVQAHMWFNLAASRGEAEAVTERDALAGRMAPEQVAKAQDQAAAWQPEPAKAPATSAARGSASPPPPKAIREAQELLAALGYEPDSDGHWGERTAQAYQAFVRDANLPKTDTLTPSVLKTMRARARQAGAVTAPKPKATLPPDALHRAAKAGNLKGLEAALASGAEVNARDDKGWTALMYVVDKGYVLLVEPVLQAKSDPDVRAPDGATALFMAVAHGHAEIIPLLMRAGADPKIKGPKGKTAKEVAQARYGKPKAARKKGEDDAVIALLYGWTWDLFSFERALSLGTLEAYTAYLSEFPQGRYIEKARRLQAERKRPPISLTATSPAGTAGHECAECPEMVVVPAGQFRMGNLSGDDIGYERPVHDVTIAAPFAVGKYQVTFAEWDACVAGDGCTYRADDVGRRRGTRPVMDVSWEDAQDYVRWLSREIGKLYRLLSEAEWEYVVRAGTTTKYPWDDDGSTNNANAFGLFDTANYVKEWVADCWNDSYQGAPNDGSAWARGDCDRRVVRGGS